MAGAVRQPIDVSALERYISQNVPVIKVPLGVKQVFLLITFSLQCRSDQKLLTDAGSESLSSDSVNPTPPTFSQTLMAKDL